MTQRQFGRWKQVKTLETWRCEFESRSRQRIFPCNLQCRNIKNIRQTFTLDFIFFRSNVKRQKRATYLTFL
jgi:hypothetical protein